MLNYNKLLYIINNSNSECELHDSGTFVIHHEYSYSNSLKINIMSYWSDDNELYIYASALSYGFNINEMIISSLLKPYFQEKYKLKVENIRYI